LDLDLITSKKRRSIEGDRFENKGDDFLEKVRKGYLDLAKKYPRRIRVINAALSFDDVFKQIKESFYDFSTREISSV
jgi:thymidylate kinase